EDGIRDYKVTGVQTCALPISRGRRPSAPPSIPGGALGRRPRALGESPSPLLAFSDSLCDAMDGRKSFCGPACGDVRLHPFSRRRSEERRVGREWISVELLEQL